MLGGYILEENIDFGYSDIPTYAHFTSVFFPYEKRPGVPEFVSDLVEIVTAGLGLAGGPVGVALTLYGLAEPTFDIIDMLTEDNVLIVGNKQNSYNANTQDSVIRDFSDAVIRNVPDFATLTPSSRVIEVPLTVPADAGTDFGVMGYMISTRDEYPDPTNRAFSLGINHGFELDPRPPAPGSDSSEREPRESIGQYVCEPYRS
jgi:hypothetical protein